MVVNENERHGELNVLSKFADNINYNFFLVLGS
jgi:hypothetical protein